MRYSYFCITNDFHVTLFRMADVRMPTPEPISLRDHPLENIRYFKRQWKYFSISTGLDKLSEEKKVASFFLFIGREALTYIHDNLQLSGRDLENCDRILDALEKSYQPRTNVIQQRFLFHQTVQDASDTVDHYVNKLRELAEKCGFEDRLEEMVRDRFIIGLKNKEIQQELLSQSELSLKNAVHICKLKELEEENNSRMSNQSIDNAPEIPSRAHSTTLDADTRPVEFPVKAEKHDNDDDDDDLIILNHYQRDGVTSSNRAAKKIKLEPLNGVDDGDESLLPVADFESNQSRDANSLLTKLGSFVVLKEDWNKLTDPPIWKVDSLTLLQKFIPIEHDGITLYKSTDVYR